MDSDSTQDEHLENVSSGEVEVVSNNIDSLEVVSSSGDTHKLAEILTRVELELACSSEKLVNLDILVMQVASRESDYEAFGSEDKHVHEAPAERALEFDLLYVFLESEVREVESFLSDLQIEIDSSHELISSFKNVGYGLKELEEKLQDCEDSLKRSFEQVSDIKTQSVNFQRILLASSGDENRSDNDELSGLEDGSSSRSYAKIKMQTAEQQRDILRMLEKSMAKEMDLEKKLSESRQTEHDLRFRLQQQVYCMEEEAEEMWERLFEAENGAEIFMGITKELFGRLETTRFSLNGSTQREGDLRLKLENLCEQLKEKDFALQGFEGSKIELLKKINSQEKINEDLDAKNKDYSEKINELEVKATEAEIFKAECKLLRESNTELDKEVNCLKTSITNSIERVEQLERQLEESENKRLEAVACAEASEEKQSVLDRTIKDMENLIKNLKSKVLKTESRTEIAEDKCVMLSESNAELNEEISFLRRKVNHLETSLLEADDAKKETARDIRVRTKLIMDLVMQLTVERERLRKQISSLKKEKKAAVKYLQSIKDPSVTVIGSLDSKVKKHIFSENDSKVGTSTKQSKMESSVTSDVIGNEQQQESPTTEIETLDADTTSDINAVRNIDAGQLKNRACFLVVLIFAIPAFVAYLSVQSGE